MTLDAIQCFCVLVEEGAFSRTAERMHRTQPAISQTISRLEREIGTALFDRKRGRPTPAGVALYERGRRMLQSADEALRTVRDIGASKSVPIRVGTSDTVAIYRLPAVVRELSRRMPDTRVTIVNRASSVVGEQVSDGLLDLGVVTMPAETTGLVSKKLFDQRIVLGVPRSHPLAGRKRVKLETLTREPMLLLSDETRTGAILRRHFVDQEFAPRVLLDSVSFEVVKAHIIAGNGVGFLPEETVHDSGKQIVGVQVPGLPRIAIGALWRRRATRSVAMDAFIDLLCG